MALPPSSDNKRSIVYDMGQSTANKKPRAESEDGQERQNRKESAVKVTIDPSSLSPSSPSSRSVSVIEHLPVGIGAITEQMASAKQVSDSLSKNLSRLCEQYDELQRQMSKVTQDATNDRYMKEEQMDQIDALRKKLSDSNKVLTEKLQRTESELAEAVKENQSMHAEIATKSECIKDQDDKIKGLQKLMTSVKAKNFDLRQKAEAFMTERNRNAILQQEITTLHQATSLLNKTVECSQQKCAYHVENEKLLKLKLGAAEKEIAKLRSKLLNNSIPGRPQGSPSSQSSGTIDRIVDFCDRAVEEGEILEKGTSESTLRQETIMMSNFPHQVAKKEIADELSKYGIKISKIKIECDKSKGCIYLDQRQAERLMKVSKGQISIRGQTVELEKLVVSYEV